MTGSIFAFPIYLPCGLYNSVDAMRAYTLIPRLGCLLTYRDRYGVRYEICRMLIYLAHDSSIYGLFCPCVTISLLTCRERIFVLIARIIFNCFVLTDRPTQHAHHSLLAHCRHNNVERPCVWRVTSAFLSVRKPQMLFL
jgi:hypothetical protein